VDEILPEGVRKLALALVADILLDLVPFGRSKNDVLSSVFAAQFIEHSEIVPQGPKHASLRDVMKIYDARQLSLARIPIYGSVLTGHLSEVIY
jgi:hypothetical protein